MTEIIVLACLTKTVFILISVSLKLTQHHTKYLRVETKSLGSYHDIISSSETLLAKLENISAGVNIRKTICKTGKGKHKKKKKGYYFDKNHAESALHLFSDNGGTFLTGEY